MRPAAIPAFIGGFRSGTTLLVNLLGMHPEIAPWFETKELCEALRWLRVLRDSGRTDEEAELIQPREPAGFSPAAVTARMDWQVRRTMRQVRGEEGDGKAPHERYPLGGDCILYTLAEAEEALERWESAVGDVPEAGAVAGATGVLVAHLGSLQAGRAGKPLWINKTPEIPRFGEELRACLGPCRVVLMIRNGWEVVRSAHALGWGDVETLARWWKGLIEQSRTAARRDWYLEVRYEDLVSRPVRTLDKILGFLALPPRGQELWGEYRARGGGVFPTPRSLPSPEPGARAVFDRIAGEWMEALRYV